MIWMDGNLHECVQDTAYSPVDQPEAWRKDGGDIEAVVPVEQGESVGDDDLGDGTPPQWAQPTGGHNAYKKGDRVAYNGAVCVSTIDDNVWAPDVYGWTME